MAMFKNFKDLIPLFVIVVAIYAIYFMFFRESFEDVSIEAQPAPEQPAGESVVEQPAVEQPTEPVLQQPIVSTMAEQAFISEEKPTLSAEELLPKYDEANEFAKQNPVSELLKEQNFLISGYHMGVNTVMQSNKIAFHDLRAAPPIPKENISPFLQSSYETPAGTNRRSLEII